MNRRLGPSSAPFAARADIPRHRPDINPYRDGHAAFGRELLPADAAPALRGRWAAEFGREAPIQLELGLGNGSWLATAAAGAPDQDWIGLEIRYKRCVQTAEKVRKAGSTNARVVRYSWFALAELFADGELSGIWIHHPDPWSHPLQAKHRLIDDAFVALAARLVRPGGELRLKTDYKPHRQALLAGVAASPGWEVVGTSDDIRRDGAPWPDDVVTGYQAKFDAAGEPVYAARLRRV